jgi:hypothetical protein
MIRDLDYGENKLTRIGNTLFVPLPRRLRIDIAGGCQCSYCKAHPHNTPQWDTLAIDATNPLHTWTVHYPETRD